MWWKEIDASWSLFLDRDGVINERLMGDYVTRPKDFHFIKQSKNAIVYFSSIFDHIFVVTNQQGVSKGIMTDRNLLEVHRYMIDEIEKAGGKITKCYAATELKDVPNGLRKPNPGMGLLAKQDFPLVDFSKSIMVGDTDSDIYFGKNLGMKTVRIKTIEFIGVEADTTVNSLNDLIKLWEK